MGAEATDLQTLRDRVAALKGQRTAHERRLARVRRELADTETALALAPKVTKALEDLSTRLFDAVIGKLQLSLTQMIQEVLEQPIQLRAATGSYRGGPTVEFHLERDGHPIDIMEGSGGSVANVLSVGLRLFALATLDEKRHARVLVLDEQDCWLKPDLVPRLVRIVHEAATSLGFQVIMISHHAPALFGKFAEKVYEFRPEADGTVRVTARETRPPEIDG